MLGLPHSKRSDSHYELHTLVSPVPLVRGLLICPHVAENLTPWGLQDCNPGPANGSFGASMPKCTNNIYLDCIWVSLIHSPCSITTHIASWICLQQHIWPLSTYCTQPYVPTLNWFGTEIQIRYRETTTTQSTPLGHEGGDQSCIQQAKFVSHSLQWQSRCSYWWIWVRLFYVVYMRF